jgi:hypothetical protein
MPPKEFEEAAVQRATTQEWQAEKQADHMASDVAAPVQQLAQGLCRGLGPEDEPLRQHDERSLLSRDVALCNPAPAHACCGVGAALPPNAVRQQRQDMSMHAVSTTCADVTGSMSCAPAVTCGAWPKGQGVGNVAAVGCGKVSQQLLSRGALRPGWCRPCAGVHSQRPLLVSRHRFEVKQLITIVEQSFLEPVDGGCSAPLPRLRLPLSKGRLSGACGRHDDNTCVCAAYHLSD